MNKHLTPFRLFSSTIMTAGLIAPNNLASAAEKMARNLDAEVAFSTNFDSTIYDRSEKSTVASTSSDINLSWLPIFWHFQLGPILSSSVKESQAPYAENNIVYDRKITISERAAGLRGKVNFTDLGSNPFVPWIGATVTHALSDTRVTYTSQTSQEVASDAYSTVSQELFADIGATIFANMYVGFVLSYSHRMPMRQETGNRKLGQVAFAQKDTLRLGISTFF